MLETTQEEDPRALKRRTLVMLTVAGPATLLWLLVSDPWVRVPFVLIGNVSLLRAAFYFTLWKLVGGEEAVRRFDTAR